MKLLGMTAVLVAATACGATLKTTPAKDGEFSGIRVHAPVSYRLTKCIKTQKCTPKLEQSIVHLPLGDAYDVSFERGTFSNDQFSVSFGDTGILKQVTLNSDPQVDETLVGLATLVEKVAGATKVAAAPRDCGDTISDTIVSVQRLKLDTDLPGSGVCE